MLRALVTARHRGGGTLPVGAVSLQGVLVDRGHLATYDRLCGFTVREELPSTYLHLLSFRLQMALMAEPGFPLALPGLVHTEQRLELRRPVSAGERLDLTARATALRPHRRGRVVEIESEAAVDGRCVWRGASTYLARGDVGADGASGAPSEMAVAVPAQPAPSGSRSSHAVPAGPPAARWRLPADLGRRYAAISGDLNPIHLHPLAAKAFGFPRTIVHGMWTAARCLAWLDDRPAGAQVVDVQLRGPVLLPSTIELRTSRAGGRQTAWVTRPAADRPLVVVSVEE